MQPSEDEAPVSLDEITPQIWIGNYWAAYDVASLKMVGSILNLMSQDDEREIKPWLDSVHGNSLQTIKERRQELKIETVRLVDDQGNELRQLRNAIDALSELVRESPPVLVHCRAGRGRSPAVVAGYFIMYGGLTAKEALEKVAQKRDIYKREEGGKEWVVNFLERLEAEARP
jgi:protein tyrosine phosphatase